MTVYNELYDNYKNKNCMVCGFKLTVDTNITEEQFLKLFESEKDNYKLKIYNICKESDFLMKIYM